MTRAGLSATLSTYDDLEIVASVAQAEAGLDLCKTLAPAVVLLDLHLPGKMGPKTTVETYCTMCCQSKIIVYSAETRMAFIQAVLKAGAAGYLLKSEPPERLVEVIRKVTSSDSTTPILSRELFTEQKKLSKAEQHILALLAQGKRYKEIAEARGTSVSTVRSQCDFLQMTLELKSREELIAWAVQNGFANL